jgi:hypothetical protein
MNRIHQPSGAIFSECGKYRYSLWRRWGPGLKTVAFICVNPSVANEQENDPTITRCINFAKAWGFDRLMVLNAFAFVKTKLGRMKLDRQHIGELNDEILLQHRNDGTVMVAAWGNHCPHWRAEEVVSLLARDLMCLGQNKNGSPKHPLMQPADLMLQPYKQVAT